MAAATRSLRPHRSAGRSAYRVVVPVLLGLVGLAGCSRSVEVTVPQLASDASCTAASGAWPTTVSGLSPVDVSPQSPAVRAWGDPAIVARCGVATPGPTTDSCLSVNGIDWVLTELTDGSKFVTYGRVPAIEVLVPRRYAPEGALLPVFTEAATRLPTTGNHCTGPP
ncbi:DUF3515 family protein [Lapillicoccus sp.]|uniref:DUF3515 family protein n=1 Tax=Lapillicoccus sp. TaxID=1909287 RepID=UPI00398376F0